MQLEALLDYFQADYSYLTSHAGAWQLRTAAVTHLPAGSLSPTKEAHGGGQHDQEAGQQGHCTLK
jgi:hypothetical protein